jgi:hypothetical protein
MDLGVKRLAKALAPPGWNSASTYLRVEFLFAP